MNWMTQISAGSLDMKTICRKVLSALMRKSVQELYTGCGREVNGKSKKDFSSTLTFACLKGTD